MIRPGAAATWTGEQGAGDGRLGGTSEILDCDISSSVIFPQNLSFFESQGSASARVVIRLGPVSAAGSRPCRPAERSLQSDG